ncbi:MAG: SCO family protein [Crocinitomicaceae bacterium]|nr:SCO family protein [Crocinitomicaceae bacterium]
MQKRLLIFGLIAAIGITIAGILNMQHYGEDPESGVNRAKNNRLRVINPSDVNPKLVDPSLQDVSKDHTISDFAFLNQLGDTITKADVQGKIYVTDFFFTTCGGICPKMTHQLTRIQAEFLDDPNVMILSHTVNPSTDTVQTLYKYANRFKADSSKWWFLTGSKKDLYLMARKSYLVVPDEADPDFEHGGESDFLHTENFALIDPDGRIRGMYDGTKPMEVDEIIRDIYDLKKEYELD